MTTQPREFSREFLAAVLDALPIGLQIWQLDPADDSPSFRLITANAQTDEAFETRFASQIGCKLDEVFPEPYLTPILSMLTLANASDDTVLGEHHIHDVTLRIVALPDRCIGLMIQPSSITPAEAHLAERLRVSNKLLRKQIRDRRNAELAEREQRALAEALRDTAAILNSTLNLDEVLDEILANVGRVVPHDSANIMLIEQGFASIARSRGYEERGALNALHAIYFPVNSLFDLRSLIQAGEPVILADTHATEAWAEVPESKWVRSYIGAPIRMDGSIIGFLNLDSATPNFFCPEHVERLKVFTDQAAIAIKNARLYEQARKLAVLQERERLARDLHDAVSQTLWSASLIADVLPTLWEQDAEEGKRHLEQLQELTHAARDEMRSLLLDLRPNSISQIALRDLIAQLAKTLGGRTGIDMHFNPTGDANLPAAVQICLYRIAQEALNNVIKHAHASRVDINLILRGDEVFLSIADNGCGFDRSQLRAGHFGHHIMKERAESIGAALEIDTSPQGTDIHVHWKQSGTNL